MNRIVLAAAIAFCAPLASAQAPAAAPAGPEVSPHACGKAPTWPGPERTNRQTIEFEKEWKVWSACAKSYIDKHRPSYEALGKQISELSSAYNAVVDEVNKASQAEKKK